MLSVLVYTLFGGMWSVAVTDFVQMIILVAGLLMLAFAETWRAARARWSIWPPAADLFKFLPEPSLHEITYVFFIGAAVTMMLGSIPAAGHLPARDVGDTEKSAVRGTIIGGACYVIFAFVPMFLVASALIIMPAEATALLADDPQKVLPTLVMDKMPFAMQVVLWRAVYGPSSPARRLSPCWPPAHFLPRTSGASS